jgi:tetratricopeptide (TPR) repeat protein
MSKEHKELAARPSPRRFPRRVPVLVSFAALVLIATPVHALANSFLSTAFLSTEGAVQSAPEIRRPQAKSEQERNEFNTAYALTSAASAETAANEFAANYPESELRRYLYSSAMLLYQRENNSAKMLAMGEKVLELDSDNPLVLVLTATALADGLGDRDRDREKKVGTIKRNATRAIQAAEASYASGAGGAAKIYKSTLQAMAYSALGIMKLKTGDDAGAEKDLSMAADLAKIHPDPYVWYHLALAQDHRKKYAAALTSVEQALQLASSDPDLQKLAEVEHERLAGLTKGPHTGETPEPQ